jgi:Uma2 family endonuclease
MNKHAASAKRPATYQDVLDAPAGMVAELVHGALHLHPRPAFRHARASFRIASRLGDPYDSGVGGPGGWIFAIEPELQLGSDVLVPDLAGWRHERVPPDAPAVEIAPDWVCELLSPGTRRFDLTEKRAVYAARGVEYLWLIDPDEETLEAFALRDGVWVLLGTVGGSDEVRLPPFEAIGFPLAALWS